MNNIKNLFGLFSLSILLLSFSNCGSSMDSKVIRFETNPPFTISEIFAQDWVAGIKQGGSGTEVHVIFSALDENLKIETIYFANKMLLARQAGNNSKEFIGSYRTLSGRDIIMDDNPVKEAKNTPQPAFPFQLESDEAVIKYIEGSTSKFFKVSGVLIKPRIAYPATNRN